MKINYQFHTNHFKIYNEVQGIAISKNKILKTKSLQHISGYCGECLKIFFLLLLCSFLILIFFHFIKIPAETLKNLLLFFVEIDVIFFGYYCFLLYNMWIPVKKNSSKGSFEITEKGICDKSDSGITISTTWENVEFIAVHKYAVTIVLNTHYVFYQSIEQKEKILEAVKNNCPDIPVFVK